jgi:Mg/Co/Ni transporter MgtE
LVKSPLKVHPEAAASLAVAHVPMFSRSLSAADTRAQLRTAKFDVVEVVLVVDDDGRFTGAARLEDVLQAPDKTPLSSLAVKAWPVVGPETDQEHAADLAHQQGPGDPRVGG